MAVTINASTSAGLISTADTSGILQLQTANTTALTVDASQNVGIGTASPSEKLSVSGNSSVNIYKLRSNTSAPASTDAFIYRPADNTLGFGTASSEKMRLDSSGNLGLGVTPSAWWSGAKVMQLGSGGYVQGRASTATTVEIGANQFINSSVQRAYITTGAASYYEQSNGSHLWYTAASGTAGNAITFTQAMTLTAAGNLAVGTTSTTARMNIAVAYSSDTATSLGDVSKSHLHLGYPGYNNQYCQITFGYDAVNAAAAIGYVGTSASGSTNGVLVFATRDVTTSTLPTERARITTGGSLFVGTTSGSGKFVCANTNNTSGDFNIVGTLGANCNNTSSYHLLVATGGSDKLYIYGNGNVVNTNNSYGSLSDSKLKENIVDASPKLADLMQVQVRNYNLIGETTKQLGVVAQELETVFPAMVDVSPDRDGDGNDLGTTTKSVKYSVFVPMLIKALQELKAEFDAYKASHP